MNTKFTKTVAVTGLTVSAFVAVCGFANTAFADEAPAVVNTPVENPAPGSFRARLLANQAVLNALNENPKDKTKISELIKAAKEESKKATQEANQPQAENKKAEEDRTAKKDQTVEDENLGSVDDNAVKGVAALGLKTLEEYEATLKSQNKKLSEEQKTLYKNTLKTKLETLEKTYLEALDYAETIVKHNVQGADESLKNAAEEFLKNNRDLIGSKSFAESDLATVRNVWNSSDEFNKKITPGLKSAIAQAKRKASEAAQRGTEGSQVESPAPAYPAPASPQAPNPADSEKNEAPSSQGAASADAPSASAPSAGSSSAGAPSEDEISDLDIEDDWLKEISDYLESPEFDDLMKSYNFDNSNSNNSNSNTSNSNNSNSDDFNLDDFNLDDFNFDDFNLDDFDLSDFDFSDIDFSDVDLNA